MVEYKLHEGKDFALFIALSYMSPIVRSQILVKRMNYVSVLFKLHSKEIKPLRCAPRFGGGSGA